MVAAQARDVDSQALQEEERVKRRLDIRPVADRDLEEHFAYIASDNLEAATRLYDAAWATYRELAEMPGMGARCDEDLPRHWRGLRRGP